ncbi:MAG: TetR/AcrR family transcriptional regulator [Eubacterium sp.]|nr:TetR/AcrR family transcriptional regulator [Eubacterium sp.]MBQ8981010.1 TetR/AcrR family transcriptional regulator [Eubacterium sp.]MBR1530955.1 TetR/AcrR family transcriptional regulator [Eubacterium sp.]
MDKRIIKTRLAVYNAVFDLAMEKDLDKITVVELCDRASINKSTFYLHYKSIDDCFTQCFDYFAGRILDLSKGIDYIDMSVAPEKTVSAILDAVEQNIKYFERFKNSVIYDSAIHSLKEKFIESICKINNINPVDNYHEVAKVNFLVGGCADVIIKMMPDFRRDEIEKIMVSVIKRK